MDSSFPPQPGGSDRLLHHAHQKGVPTGDGLQAVSKVQVRLDVHAGLYAVLDLLAEPDRWDC
jgi:hypothetical protein